MNVDNNNTLANTNIEENIDVSTIQNHTSSTFVGDLSKPQPSSGSLKKVNILFDFSQRNYLTNNL